MPNHTVDYAYYAEKQLKQPLARIMELVCDANTLFPYTPLTVDVNREQLKRLGITATRRTVTKRRKLADVDAETCAKWPPKIFGNILQ